MTICWTDWITFRNLCTQQITEHVFGYVDNSWIIPFCLEKLVNFTQTCKILLLFWSYVFGQRTIHDLDLATTFQRDHQYHLAKILTKSHYRGALSASIWLLSQCVLKVYQQYGPTCPRCTRDIASSKHKLLRKLFVLLFFPGGMIEGFWKKDLYLSKDFKIRLSCSIWCFMIVTYEKSCKVPGLSSFYWNTR